MFKGLTNLAGLRKQAQEMGCKMQGINEQLKSQRASASVGGGMVEVEVNGLGEVLHVKIDPTLVEKGDREMIEDLLPAAINQASAKAKQLHAEAMGALTAGLNVPGLNEAIAEMTGGDVGNE